MLTSKRQQAGGWHGHFQIKTLSQPARHRQAAGPVLHCCPVPTASAPAALEPFIARWQAAGGAERANYQAFLSELCDVLEVPRPNPALGSEGPYRFERRVDHREGGATTARRIDLYRQGCFVCEAKQGNDALPQASLFTTGTEAERRAMVRHSPQWKRYMEAARQQAEGYARDVPPGEGWPPFLIVCDIGFCIDLYADFSGLGKHYGQFPDANGFRIYLSDLRDPAIRARLRAVWTDPHTLDPAKHRATVTRDIAAYLAKLAKELEGTNPAAPRHAPQHVATFLMRCIFCMFAQSVGLLPERTSFSDLLERCRGNTVVFVGLVGDLWRTMDAGGFSAALAATVRRFNGGLFRPGVHGPAEPLAVRENELALLIQAASKDWADVEPAIFGTLLESALDRRQRAKLGAEFTPRPFVERLVLPTVMEPLRLQWDAVRAAAEAAMADGKPAEAAAEVRRFHAELCRVRVLDPACGTGNFLYVTLELMKRLEGDVLDTLAGYAAGEAGRLELAGATVSPQQFLGLDVNPRAVPVAELVLWIGYLQWHYRTHGAVAPAEPILRDFHNIREADALLRYTREEPERDGKGSPVTRWGGKTKLHPITGEDVPDETDRVHVLRPVGAKQAAWPEADFIVGNPPFVAGKDMRAELGSGYAEALWAAYPKVPESADLALFFWWRAAALVQAGKVRRFGFITSNSIRQVFCRRVVAGVLEGKNALHLAFAIPDHPWSQGAGSAAVRIAMTVAAPGRKPGRLLTAEREGSGNVPAVELREAQGTINADLTIGATPASATPIQANERMCSPGVKLHGAGFIVTPAQAAALGLGKVPGLERHIRPYLNGRDMVARSRGVMVIDLYGLTEAEVRAWFPAVFEHLLLRVKPKRDAMAGNSKDSAAYAKLWWLHGKPRSELRPALAGLPRYIATVETAKHRVFVFQPTSMLPDNMLVCIASADAWHLGVLSSRIHTTWAPAAGGWLGFGNDPRYNKTRCFDPFPFPEATPAQQETIGAAAEALDAHRKTRLAAHAQLTLTRLYNALEALRAGRALEPAEKDVTEAGQVATLLHLHDTLDAAVADAYGWPVDLPAANIVARVVALNAERRAEEREGLVRWLRPEYQAPAEAPAARAKQGAMPLGEAAGILPPWPKDTVAQYQAVLGALSRGIPVLPADLARQFKGARLAKLAPMLNVLAGLGQARQDATGRYVR